MLKTSTKNVAQEVVSCLIESNGSGVLTKIIRWLNTKEKKPFLFESRTSILEQQNLKTSQLIDTDAEFEDECSPTIAHQTKSNFITKIKNIPKIK